jgi:hypothetical protein
MRVVVVKPRSVAKNQIAFYFDVAQFALRILRKVICFIGILAKFGDSKSAHVCVRVFRLIIPTHPNARLSGAADESNRFRDHVELECDTPPLREWFHLLDPTRFR